MKFVLSAIIVLFVANIKTVRDDKELKIWQIVWDHLKAMAGDLKLHPDSGLNITQFLEKYNYPLESHDVTTEDGYILTLHRIPHGTRNTMDTKGTKPAILLVHCLACSAMDWIWQGPDRSLALHLADLGYDVWLANTRGNVHSLRHQTLNPANTSFWDFSFHEKGYYDAPAIIDYILANTNVEKITYIGHSQGTSAGLVLTSSRPEYNDKMNLMILLSPIAYMEHVSSPIVIFLERYMSMLKVATNLFGIHGMVYNPYLSLVTDIFCNEASSVQSLCGFFIDLFAGFDPEQVDKQKITVFLTNTPSGLSIRDIEHYTQEISSGKFSQYDYGNSIANYMHYGSSDPPSYNVSEITVPLAIYYAKNDFLAHTKDVEKLISKLETDIVEQCLIEYEYFNHLDFITAKDVKTMLYDKIIKLIQQTSPISIT